MGELLEYEKASALLKKYGIRSIESRYVANPKDAVAFAKGRPIVMKAISQKALHKNKSGLVELNLADDKEITEAFARLEKAAKKFRPYRILAQVMVSKGTEIIMGGNIDQQFGKMVLLGLGGIYVETFRDFALRACPITKYDAWSMVEQLKSKGIIAPDGSSMKLVTELLLKVSKMFDENDIKELDLNPIMLHDGTYDAVDLRVLK